MSRKRAASRRQGNQPASKEDVETDGAASGGSSGRHTFVVGIGASAGGLQPLQEFFGNMPQDSGLAFVVVQHRSPEFKSLMNELLSRHTNMAVFRAEDGMLLEGNSVYLIPPKRNAAIAEGRLVLTEQDYSRGHLPGFPIDMFLQSLAETLKDRAIGVILSGTGSDGTRGARAINEAGGIVLVQHPKSAEFDGMPHSVIDMGLADYVLPPADLSHAIYDYVTKAPGSLIKGAARSGLESTLRRITMLVAGDQGIDFSHYKSSTLERRTERRRVISGCATIEAYMELLAESEEERAALRNDLLINVTGFFRDADAWAYLEQKVVPRLMGQAAESHELRIWVPACSTGEEAYSMAMLVQEALEAAELSVDVKIFATDIDEAALQKAAAGVYNEGIIEDVNPQRVQRYFRKKGRGFQISRQLREMMIFAPHNLTRDPPFTRMHLVSCRNLLIYMQPNIQQHVLTTLHFALQPQGLLFLGAAETVGDLQHEFAPVHRKWKVFQKKRDVKLPLRGAEGLLLRAAHTPPVVRQAPDDALGRRLESMAGEAFGAFLRDQNTLCLLVTPDHQLLQVFGDSRPFLTVPEGKAPLDVTRMVCKPLSLPLSTALYRARTEKRSVSYSGVKVTQDGVTRHVDLHISYHANGNTWPEFLMILLNVAGPAATAPAVECDMGSQAAQRMTELEQDLQQTRENLQATIEELETTNEEQQTTNQELLASNEELQSTNEELQSVNEELNSVNAAYQLKIQELTDLNNDMDNLLSSTEIGTVFLDKDLQIRKFTPAVAAVVKLQEQDVGRPIDQISYGIDMDHDALIAHVKRVLETQTPLEFNVESRRGRSLLMRINPYRDEAARSPGVVLAFVDVSEIKQAEEAVRRGEDRIRRIVDSALDGVITIDETGQVSGWNPQAERIFGWTEEEAVGQILADLIIPESQRGAHRKGLIRYLETGEAPLLNRRIELEAIRRNGEEFPVELTVVPLRFGERQEFCGFIRDITERKQAEETRARLATIVESSADAIIGKTISGKMTSWNAAAERMYGYTAAEAIGERVSMLIPADRQGELAELLERLKRGEQFKGFETVRHTKLGRKIDVSLTISPIFGRTGQVVGAATIARDITLRKRTETKLRLLQAVTELISVSTDLQSAMENALVKICEAIGWDYGEAWVPNLEQGVLERCAGSYIGSERLESFSRMSKRLKLPLDEGLPGHVWSSRKPEWFLDVSSEVPDEFIRADLAAQIGLKGGFAVPIIADGEVLAVLSFFMMSEPREEDLALVIDLVYSVASQVGSVVRRKKIDADLKKANDALQRKNREMEEFVHTVSHDLKSPLVSIGGTLGILKEELQEERFVDAGELMVSAEQTVVQMRNMIDDLLELGRIGQVVSEVTPVDLSELVNDLIEQYGEQLDEKGVLVDIGENLPTVSADRNRLVQVFANLIANAVKYACDGPHPRIVIGCETNGQETYVFVKDNGPGIEENQCEKIFGLFQRFDTTKEGTGVGLAIVRRIMDAHGGRAWVESRPGEGATFWLAFPASVGDTAMSGAQ